MGLAHGEAEMSEAREALARAAEAPVRAVLAQEPALAAELVEPPAEPCWRRSCRRR